jgi:hypothetical protein
MLIEINMALVYVLGFMLVNSASKII